MFHVVGCNDKLPTDYGTVEGRCNAGWTCPDWSGNGTKNSARSYCADNWSNHGHCVPQTTGLVKDYCKFSCDTCGKNIISRTIKGI